MAILKSIHVEGLRNYILSMVTELLQSMFVQNLFHFVDMRIEKQPFTSLQVDIILQWCLLILNEEKGVQPS